MNTSNPVSLTTDLMIPGICLSAHTSAPVGPTLPHIEPPLPLLWPLGMAVGQNQFTSKVLHAGRCIALMGHDMGILIPHIPWGTNVLLPIVMLFSSRPVNFSSSTVVAEGTSIAVIGLYAPMSFCSVPVSLPLGVVVNMGNTVSVAYTETDQIMGAVSIAASLATDLLCARIGSMAGPSPFASNLLRDGEGNVIARNLGSVLRDPRFRHELAQQFLLGGSGGNGSWANAVAQWAFRTGVNLVTGLTRTRLTGRGSVTVGVGQPYLGTSSTVNLAPHEGAPDGSRSVAGHDASVAGQYNLPGTTHTVTSNADGSQTTTDTTYGPVGLHATSRHVDAQGRPMDDDNTVTDNHPWGSAL